MKIIWYEYIEIVGIHYTFGKDKVLYARAMAHPDQYRKTLMFEKHYPSKISSGYCINYDD